MRSTPEPAHGPVQAEHLAVMNALARGIDDALNPQAATLPGVPSGPRERQVGFLLCVFNFGEQPTQGRFNYISNAEALDVLATLKEIAARLEGRLFEGAAHV